MMGSGEMDEWFDTSPLGCLIGKINKLINTFKTIIPLFLHSTWPTDLWNFIV